ncbi:MAG: hypothetical protein KF884_11175 [Fimbriimonadaceae bacterium]|nr:hypothetical protein [Fimbriimonadaceae bacterium]QYK58106.1 MAG: hypothetical protein KF884_11175 [Fimbriimonadaceae bacterium]
MTTSLLMCAAMCTVGSDLKIIEVRETRVFAGKLGQRVTLAAEAEVDGKPVHVQFTGAYHTRAAGRRIELKVGQTIHVHGVPDKRTLKVSLEAIH